MCFNGIRKRHVSNQDINNIAEKGLSHFPQDQYQVSPDIVNPDAMIVRSASLHDIVIPDSVKVIGRAGARVNNIPVPTPRQTRHPYFKYTRRQCQRCLRTRDCRNVNCKPAFI